MQTVKHFAPFMDSGSCTLTCHYSINDRDVRQKVSWRINIAITLISSLMPSPSGSGNIKKRFLHVDLSGSDVSVGDIKYDQNDIRGIFLQDVVYKMWLQSPGVPKIGSANPHIAIQAESPDSPNQSGSISSNLSYHVNGSAGFFGPTPTGGVSGGVTIGSSYSHTIKD